MNKSNKSIRNKKNIIVIILLIIFVIGTIIVICRFFKFDNTRVDLFDILKINKPETEELNDGNKEDNSSITDDNGNNQGTGNNINNSTSTTTSTETNPNEGWKYFESDECKIGLYYPSNWYILTYNDGVRCFFVSTTEDPSGSKGVENSFLMMIGINNTTSKKFINDLRNNGSNVIVNSKIVDGIERPYIIQETELLGTYHYILYNSGSNNYKITWSGTQLGAYQEQIDKLINGIDIK